MIFSWPQVAAFLAAMTASAWLLYPDAYMQGQMYRHYGDRSQAIVLFKRYLAEHPGHKGATLGLAAAYEAAGRPEEAVEPLLEFYRGRRGDLDAAQAAIALLEGTLQEERADDLRWELIADMRDLPPAGRLRLEGLVDEAMQRAVAAQDDKRALHALAILAGISSDGGSYRDQMLRLMLSRGLLDRALTFLQADLRSAPDNHGLRRTIARILLARGDERASLNELASGMARAPRFAGYLADRAGIHLDAKRWSQAETDLRRLVDLEPEEDAWTSELARCLVESGRLPEAVTLLEDRVAKDPADPQRWWDLVWLFVDRNMHAPAAERLEKMLARFPGDERALDMLVSERRRSGRPDLAIAVLAGRVASVPGDMARRRALAQLLIDDERLEEASVHVEAYLAAEPENPEDWREAIYLREAVKDARGAARLCEGYLRRFPDDARMIEKLAGKYASLGERDRAIALLKGYFKVETPR